MPDFETIYREHATEYDQLVAREDFKRNILPALTEIRAPNGLDIVEMGAGTGRLTRLLAPLAKSIKAFDRSAAMLSIAASAMAPLSLENWLLAVGDNRRLPAADHSADVAIAGWSFGHATGWYPDSWQHEIDLALRQMQRLLRPGGTAIILETLGTGRETPQPPTTALAGYYVLLEEAYGFTANWIRTDYRFESVEEAERLTRFFFGDELADRIMRESLVILPECTGIWSLTI